jgi:hypothetical protein
VTAEVKKTCAILTKEEHMLLKLLEKKQRIASYRGKKSVTGYASNSSPKAVLPSLGLRVMEGERKRRRGLTNFYFAPEFIFVKVRGDNGGLTGRSVYCFLTNLFTPNLRGRKPNPPLISAVSHSIPSLSASAREHSLRVTLLFIMTQLKVLMIHVLLFLYLPLDREHG